MNYFDKNKILTAAVILLLVINIGILGLLWFDRKPGHDKRIPPLENHHPPEGGTSNAGPKDFIINELELSKDQISEYENLIEEHQSDMKKIREKIREKKEDLWNSFEKNSNDTAEAKRLASEIGADQNETELITYRHFQKVKNICTEEQKKKLDKIIKEALRMMGPQHPPPPPPPVN